MNLVGNVQPTHPHQPVETPNYASKLLSFRLSHRSVPLPPPHRIDRDGAHLGSCVGTCDEDAIVEGSELELRRHLLRMATKRPIERAATAGSGRRAWATSRNSGASRMSLRDM